MLFYVYMIWLACMAIDQVGPFKCLTADNIMCSSNRMSWFFALLTFLASRNLTFCWFKYSMVLRLEDKKESVCCFWWFKLLLIRTYLNRKCLINLTFILNQKKANFYLLLRAIKSNVAMKSFTLVDLSWRLSNCNQ